LKKILDSAITGPRKGGLSVYGTAVLVNVVNEIGAWPTKNAKDTQFESAYYLSGENLAARQKNGERRSHQSRGNQERHH